MAQHAAAQHVATLCFMILTPVPKASAMQLLQEPSNSADAHTKSIPASSPLWPFLSSSRLTPCPAATPCPYNWLRLTQRMPAASLRASRSSEVQIECLCLSFTHVMRPREGRGIYKRATTVLADQAAAAFHPHLLCWWRQAWQACCARACSSTTPAFGLQAGNAS